VQPAGDDTRTSGVILRDLPFRLSLPTWVERTLALAAPGRPLALTALDLERAAALCPASGAALLHSEHAWQAHWSAWTEPR